MPSTPTQHLDLTQLRRALLQQRDTQAARLASADGTSYTVRYLDGDAEQSLAARLEGIRRLLDETKAALQRMDDGTFGMCEACERQISAVRLEILPHARHCVGCQHHRERWRRALATAGAPATAD